MKVYRVIVRNNNGETFTRLINTTDKVQAIKELSQWQAMFDEYCIEGTLTCELECEERFVTNSVDIDTRKLINDYKYNQFKELKEKDILSKAKLLENILNGYVPNGNGLVYDYNELFANPKFIAMMGEVIEILEKVSDYKELERTLEMDKTI